MSRDKTEVAGKFHFYHWSTNGPGVKQSSIDKYVPPRNPSDFMAWGRSIQEELLGIRPWAVYVLTANRLIVTRSLIHNADCALWSCAILIFFHQT